MLFRFFFYIKFFWLWNLEMRFGCKNHFAKSNALLVCIPFLWVGKGSLFISRNLLRMVKVGLLMQTSLRNTVAVVPQDTVYHLKFHFALQGIRFLAQIFFRNFCLLYSSSSRLSVLCEHRYFSTTLFITILLMDDPRRQRRKCIMLPNKR